MCGRIRQHRPPHEFADWAERLDSPLGNWPPRYNLAPTQAALVLRRHPETGGRHLAPLRWGLIPRWAKDPASTRQPINARAETVATAPMFREAFARGRCLVPADGFYEWRAAGPDPKARKQPFAIALADGSLMALAGVWEGWRAPDGEIVRSFAVLTTEANAKLRPLHDRMPVILPRAAWPAWLGEAPAEVGELLALCRHPFDAAPLAVWPVPARVGRVSEDDPGLIERDPAAAPVPGLDDPPVLPR